MASYAYGNLIFRDAHNYIPMDTKIKGILNIVVVVAVVLWLLNLLGLMDSLRGIRIGR